MAIGLVDRATSTGLLGPEWSVNMEICDVINREPGQAKEVVKSLKKKLNSKNSRVQLLALTLLETLVKNCGDIVHMHVAERDVLHEMVKIVKKKPDFDVKEKILVLIDTWQEAFGGPRARYPQYFAAYQELLRAGVVFPQRADSTAPIFTPPQTQPITLHPQLLRSPDSRREAPETSTHDLPSLSFIEMQNARGIMDVLSEMLNALNPANREGLRQEVIVDLVDQCRSYKRRVVHLVNTTSDEALLDKGLVLNDDLERVLAKNDAIAAGIAVRVERPKPSVQVDDSGIGQSETAPGKQNDRSSTSASSSVQFPSERLLPAPPSKEKNITTTALVKMDPHMDLLSGDDFSTPAENSLALVPVNQPLALSASDHNVLALADMFASNDNAYSNSNTTISNSYPSYPAVPGQTTTTELQIPQLEKPVLHPNGGISNSKAFQHDMISYNPRSQLSPVNSLWDNQATGHPSSQQQPLTFAGSNGHGEEALPPPPWETRSVEENHSGGSQLHTIQNPLGGMYAQQIHSPSNREMYNQHMRNSQFSSFNSHPLQGVQMVATYQYPMQNGQMAVMPVQPPFLTNQAGGYAYAQQPMTQYYYNQAIPPYPLGSPNDLSQSMYGLSMQGDSRLMNVNPSHPMITASALSVQMHQPIKPPPKPEDNLFGDLLSMAKSKQRKPPINNSGSL